MDNKRVLEEHKRLEGLLDKAEVPQMQRDVLLPVIDNLAWQRIKLDEARQEMQKASVVIEYNNGGGQTGTRENPIFKAYVSLWKSYLAGFEKYVACLPKDLQVEAVGNTFTVLDEVRRLKKGRI